MYNKFKMTIFLKYNLELRISLRHLTWCFDIVKSTDLPTIFFQFSIEKYLKIKKYRPVMATHYYYYHYYSKIDS